MLSVAAAELPEPASDVLVVGGPTHAFGLSRTQTRHDAALRTDAHIGIRERLDADRDPLSQVNGHAREPGANAWHIPNSIASRIGSESEGYDNALPHPDL